DIVRVLTMGDFSIELCGGTHVNRTGDIGLFKIISESSIASGVRRIEATSGQNAMDFIHHEANLLSQIAQLVKSDKSAVLVRVEQLLEQTKLLEKNIEQLKAQKASQQSAQLINQCEKINNKNLLIAKLDNVEAKVLRTMIDDLKNQLKTGVIILAAVNDDKINLAAGVTNDLIKVVKAGELVSQLALKVGGKGGGRPDFAQAGGMDLSALPEALSSMKKEISNKLQAS
ncbi:alanine--tRNA ligase, partial [Gilliamella apicola]